MTLESGNASSTWPLAATLGNVSGDPSAAGLAVSGVLIPLVYLVVCVVGLLGNSLVIYVVLRHTASPSVTNVYILNLALADELFMLGLPFLAAQNALSYWPFGSLMCRLVMAVDGFHDVSLTPLPRRNTPPCSEPCLLNSWVCSYLPEFQGLGQGLRLKKLIALGPCTQELALQREKVGDRWKIPGVSGQPEGPS